MRDASGTGVERPAKTPTISGRRKVKPSRRVPRGHATQRRATINTRKRTKCPVGDVACACFTVLLCTVVVPVAGDRETMKTIILCELNQLHLQSQKGKIPLTRTSSTHGNLSSESFSRSPTKKVATPTTLWTEDPRRLQVHDADDAHHLASTFVIESYLTSTLRERLWCDASVSVRHSCPLKPVF